MTVETCDEDIVPQGVEVGAALVQDLGEVGVDVGGVEGGLGGALVIFGYGEGL